jgi:RND family efflux transporter MFP subunit
MPNWSRYCIALLCSFPLFAQANNQLTIPPAQKTALGIEVSTATVSTASAHQLEATAKVTVPSTSVRVVGAPSDGLITAMPNQVGDEVRKGALVVSFSSPALVEARKQLVQAQLKHRLASDNAARDAGLVEKGLLARTTLLNSQNEVDLSQADIEAAEKTIRLLGGKVGTDSSEIQLYAPLSGTVLENMAEVGQRVDISTPIIKIANLHKLSLEIPLSTEQAQQVQSGDLVSLVDYPISGSVRSVKPAVDNSQNVNLRADIEQDSIRLQPGQAVKVKLQAGKNAAPSISIPSQALVWVSDKAYVFVASKDGFTATEVKVLSQTNEQANISGISADTQVASKGVAALKAKWQEAGE